MAGPSWAAGAELFRVPPAGGPVVDFSHHGVRPVCLWAGAPPSGLAVDSLATAAAAAAGDSMEGQRPAAAATAAAETALPPRLALSIVVPTLNEAATIGATLRHALSVAAAPASIELLVVDGGSSDATAAAAAAAGARVLAVRGGPRAAQLNAGAAAAAGRTLLFLHADTALPAAYDAHVAGALAGPRVAAGAFRLGINGDGFPLRLVEAAANVRSRVLGLPYGDQAPFMRRATFLGPLGGFDAGLPFMEDFALMRRARRVGRVVLAPAAVATSARRWETLGVLRTTLMNQAIILRAVE
ncbi:hypothetical protein I4F81_001355 [Pyropia yezoensis]|uniref:Uncharacterized protein n=1 Tax=Pyropia yezoensis TaxID=2788 RepID=A0ACC3BL92_PYRYE|nr:hypothetical protein I4F81_001355 [Neopyropia yezoensis]